MTERPSFADDEKIGEIVSKVNGMQVKNMAHLAELLHNATLEPDCEEIVIDFYRTKALERAYLVFDKAEAMATAPEILELNMVPSWCSPHLLPKQASEPEPESEPESESESEPEPAATP